jgi:endonuclease/exonuclease/phosphatase family metal-dependent hydrolase
MAAPPQSPLRSDLKRYRILSYNVRYFGHALRGLASTERAKTRIADALAELDPLPDVICLQEVEHISVRSRIVAARRSNQTETQLETFMRSLGAALEAAGKHDPYEAFYFPADRYGPARLPIYTTGLAILVNIERVAVAGHNRDAPHPITHHHVAAMKNRKQTRICAHMRLLVGGKPLDVINTHLSLPSPFARQFWASPNKMGFGPNQLKEAETLSQFVQTNATEPYIVCGDFNSPPGSPVYRYLTADAGMRGVQETLGLIEANHLRGFPTAGIARLRMHLDHMFSSSNGISWLDMEGTCRYADKASPFHGCSDHVPLIARFAL